ncbi:DUF5988 family protein [Streptomyces sp. NPDC053427]|uniref:DUF5988 family protein n=1 Tax=Streptomyces sp. NPDC053427 TaxID=3365701 RepID=UPI0037D78F10
MNATDKATPYPTEPVEILLVGGPEGIGQSERRMRAVIVDSKVKIRFRDGYEHFELERRPEDSEDASTAVFRWIMRTKIAE